MSANSRRSQRDQFLTSLRQKIQLLRQNVLQHKCIDANELASAENAFIIRWRHNVKTATNNQYRFTISTGDCVRLTVALTICVLMAVYVHGLWERILGVRCIVPNNYLVWEATRPESDCQFCSGVSRPLILENITRDKFHVSSETKCFNGFLSIFNAIFTFLPLTCSNMPTRPDR